MQYFTDKVEINGRMDELGPTSERLMSVLLGLRHQLKVELILKLN